MLPGEDVLAGIRPSPAGREALRLAGVQCPCYCLEARCVAPGVQRMICRGCRTCANAGEQSVHGAFHLRDRHSGPRVECGPGAAALRCAGRCAGSGAPAPVAYGPEDFPGCESFHLPASEIDHYEGRLEFWDARTATAWKVSEPTSIQHEEPSRRLVEMATRVSVLRGSRIVSFGAADLVRLDRAGRKRWLMQADEVLYLHPDRTRPYGRAIDVDLGPLPDVVLEVDHTTDVRRRKLGIYRECGFPEIWVLVPWEESMRTPGMTIHVRREDGYREEAESRAFPGWAAEDIHRALTEDPLSDEAWRALERVALEMGAREGTEPEDDPVARSVSATARARGHADGRSLGRLEAVSATLRARGIEVAGDFARDGRLLAGHSVESLMAAALACTDEADFRRRISACRSGPGAP